MVRAAVVTLRWLVLLACAVALVDAGTARAQECPPLCDGDFGGTWLPGGCVVGCDNPWGMSGTAPRSGDPNFHGPSNYPTQPAGTDLGNGQHVVVPHAVPPVVTNTVALPPFTIQDQLRERYGLETLGTAADTVCRVGDPAVPRTTAPPQDPGYPGDTVGGPEDGKPPSDPVSHYSGEFVMSHVDLQFPGFGVPFVLERTYGSRRDFMGPLGYATDHSLNLRLVHLSGRCERNLLYMAGNGTTMEFTVGPRVGNEQTFSAPAGVPADLRALYLGDELIGYSMKQPDGTVALFSRGGFVISIRDLNGRGLDFEWDVERARLDAVIDSVGRKIVFSYDDANHVTLVKESSSGLSASYVYDPATGDLLQATDATGRSEVYEYSKGPDVPQEDQQFLPEGVLRHSCELACAPSASSCHAGGACEAFPTRASDQCVSNCNTCLNDCVGDCDTQCEAGRDRCINGYSTPPPSPGGLQTQSIVAGCNASCQAQCAAAAPGLCDAAWDTKTISFRDPLNPDDTKYSPHDICAQLEDRIPDYCLGACEFTDTPAACHVKTLQCEHCMKGDGLAGIFGWDCGCTDRGLYQVCKDAFFGRQTDSCGCDPATEHCSGDTGGCPKAMKDSCTNLCNDSCADDCVGGCERDCHLACVGTYCKPIECAQDCAEFDYAGYCADNCVDDCVAASHDFEGSRTEAPRFAKGPKYGYLSDVNHNLIRVFNADGTLRLENTYGLDITEADYDAVTHQQLGEQSVTLTYFDLATTAATAAASELMSTADDLVGALSTFQSVELCPAVCTRAPTTAAAKLDYLPSPDGIVALPQLANFPAGSFAPLGGYFAQSPGPSVPLTLFPIPSGPPGAGSFTTSAPVVGGLQSNPPIGASIALTQLGGLPPVMLKRNGNGTITLTGSLQALDVFRGAAEMTLVSDNRGFLRAYPGRPQSLIHVAAGACTDPFRAQRNAAGQLEIVPAGACSGDLSVAPMSSLVTDATARSAFLTFGPGGIGNMDLFASSALAPGRWLARWRAVPGLPGRYELSVGAGDGAAPSALPGAIAQAASHAPLLRAIKSTEPASRPFYVFHLPQSMRPSSNSGFYAWDSHLQFNPRAPGSNCLDAAIGEPIRGYGPDAPGPKPERITTIRDVYGVGWTYYYDGQGHQIRAVNQSTGAVRNFNYDSSHRLVGAEDPIGGRICSRYDANGNLIESTRFPAPFAPGDATPVHSRYEYGGSPVRLTKTYDPNDPARVSASYAYDAKGNLLEARDAMGNVTRFVPSPFGPSESATTPNGSRHLLGWDAQKGVVRSSTIDADGDASQTVVTEHDSAGRTLSQISALGDKQTWIWNGTKLDRVIRDAEGLQEAVTFDYDENLWVRESNNGRMKVQEKRDPFGNVVRRRMVALDGTAVDAVMCTRTSFDGRVLEQVLPEGTRLKPQYDAEGHMVSLTMGFLPPDPTATWDDDCVVPTAGPGVDPADIGKAYTMGRVTYDPAGRPYYIEDAFGSETRIEYDGLNRRIVIRDEMGRSIRIGYNVAGQVLWRAAYGEAGRDLPYGRPSLSDPGLMAAIEFQYDLDGRRIRRDAWHFDANHVPIGDGRSTTTYSYDTSGNSVTVTDDDGRSTTRFADGAGRPIETLLPTGERITTEYKDGGRLVVSTQPAATPGGFLLKATRLNAWGAPVAAAIGTAPDDLAEVRTWLYDAERHMRESSGAVGQNVSQTFDAFGRLQTSTSAFDDKSQEYVTNVYDRANRLRQRKSDGGGAVASTEMTYDSLGRPRAIIRPNGAVETRTYLFGSSRVANIYDARGRAFLFDYYANGQLATIAAFPWPNPTQARARSYVYDGLGRVQTARDKGADYFNATDDIVTTLEWDSLSNKTLEWDTNTGLAHAIAHRFDGTGQDVYSKLGPYEVTRAYDALGRPEYIEAGQTNLAKYTYGGPDGGPLTRKFGSGVTTTYAYDAFNRVTGISEDKDGFPLATWRYEIPLDGAPRVAGLRKGTASEIASLFIVDRSGRLDGEDHRLSGLEDVTLDAFASTESANLKASGRFGGGLWRTYALDGRSNWTSRDSADPALRTNPEINAFDGYDSFGGEAASYDPAGNLLDLGTDHYEYDDFGDLTVASGEGEALEFVYDGFGRRVRELNQLTGKVTRYTFDGQRRVGEVNADGTWSVVVDGSGPDDHVALVSSSGRTSYLHQDRMNSVYLVSDDHGNPVEWTNYTAYGEASLTDAQGNALTSSLVGNRFGFQGQASIAGLGLVDMRARFYRPSLGRFLTPDPAGFAGGANLYSFVNSAPLLWRDPLGLGPEPPPGGAPDPGPPKEPPHTPDPWQEADDQFFDEHPVLWVMWDMFSNAKDRARSYGIGVAKGAGNAAVATGRLVKTYVMEPEKFDQMVITGVTNTAEKAWDIYDGGAIGLVQRAPGVYDDVKNWVETTDPESVPGLIGESIGGMAFDIGLWELGSLAWSRGVAWLRGTVFLEEPLVVDIVARVPRTVSSGELQYVAGGAEGGGGTLVRLPPWSGPPRGLPVYVEGGPTKGIFSTSLSETTLESGAAGGPPSLPLPGRNNTIFSHVEAHAAQIMRTSGLDEATLFINRPPCSGMYGGCGQMLPTMLPEGARLRVVGPDGYDQTFIGLPDSPTYP